MKWKIKWLNKEPSAAGAVGGEVNRVRQVELAVRVGRLKMSDWGLQF